MGGQAFWDIVFGDMSPGGHLTVSWPRHVGQMPLYYNAIRGQHGGYADMDGSPQWPFGFGLTYSEVTWSNAKIDKTSYAKTDTIHISLTLLNKGPYDVAEVVQIYIHDKVTSVTWCGMELKTFERVVLKSGESRDLKIDLHVSECSIVDAQAKRVVEAGEMELWIGKSAGDIPFRVPFTIL
jgi:beta-glucosidase